MALYEIDTLKQSLKKYAVILTLGVGVGVYLSNCTFKSNKSEAGIKPAHIEYRTDYSAPIQKPRELTRQEQRLNVFETYTRP